MHEASLLLSLIEEVEALALKEAFSRVTVLEIEVGPLSGVNPECLEFCFQECTRNTLLECAKLSILSTPIEAFCKECEKNFRPVFAEHIYELVCPECNLANVEIRSGREFRIVNLLVV